MLDPGLARLADWRPDPDDLVPQTSTYHVIVGGLARKT
jgi:hypothetical protein